MKIVLNPCVKLNTVFIPKLWYVYELMRGVVLFVESCLNAQECTVVNDLPFEESVWCVLSLKALSAIGTLISSSSVWCDFTSANLILCPTCSMAIGCLTTCCWEIWTGYFSLIYLGPRRYALYEKNVKLSFFLTLKNIKLKWFLHIFEINISWYDIETTHRHLLYIFFFFTLKKIIGWSRAYIE